MKTSIATVSLSGTLGDCYNRQASYWCAVNNRA